MKLIEKMKLYASLKKEAENVDTAISASKNLLTRYSRGNHIKIEITGYDENPFYTVILDEFTADLFMKYLSDELNILHNLKKIQVRQIKEMEEEE